MSLGCLTSIHEFHEGVVVAVAAVVVVAVVAVESCLRVLQFPPLHHR